MSDAFANIDNASVARVKLALRAVEGLSTDVLRETMDNLYILQGAAAIATCKRLGIEVDTTIWGKDAAK